MSKGVIDNISGYEEEDEILLPFNTKYYIDYARHSINYYKNNIICPDETMAKKITVTDLTVIPPRQRPALKNSSQQASAPASPSQYYSAKSKSSATASPASSTSSKYYSGTSASSSK
jgi:hypothetical protein